MSQNTTKLNEKEKIPFDLKKWIIKHYINIVFAAFVILGYVLPFVVDVNQPWVLKFNRFMAGICPQVAAIERFGIEVAFNQFYFGILWLAGLIVSLYFVLFLRSNRINQTKSYLAWVMVFLGSFVFAFLQLFLVILHKSSFLSLTLVSHYTKPIYATFIVFSTQIALVLLFYSAKIVFANFISFVFFDKNNI